MDIRKIKLDFEKDKEGKYIFSCIPLNEDYRDEFIVSSGRYEETIILNKNCVEKKIAHKVEDIVKTVKYDTMTRQRVKFDDILGELFTFSFVTEEDFNPIFRTMTKEEIAEYTKDSTKIRLRVDFVINIKQQPHLWFQTHVNNLLRKITK